MLRATDFFFTDEMGTMEVWCVKIGEKCIAEFLV